MSCPLPKVDVSVALYVTNDQFGRPLVIGTPACGPDHGPGSYWYQVGYLYGSEDVKVNLAPIVYGYLAAAGRTAEFVIGQSVDYDLHYRRTTYTDAQINQQIASQAGNAFPVEILDLLQGLQQAYVDHLVKIKQGIYPLPADFVTDVGILNWFWNDVSNDITVAKNLFTLANFVKGLQGSNDFFGSSSAAFYQVFLSTLNQLDASSTAPTSDDAINIINDMSGMTSFNTRFTVKEGDRTGTYCTNTTCCGNINSFPLTKDLAKGKSWDKAKSLPLAKDLAKGEGKKLGKDQVEKIQAQVKKLRITNPRISKRVVMSDFLVVGKELTANGSAMMFGNSQSGWGFDGCPDAFPLNVVWRALSYLTPRGSTYSPQCVTTYTKSCYDYEINWSVEVTDVAARDSIFLDASAATLIYDASLDKENVPGGKAQSLVTIRNSDGTTTSKFYNIYQGNATYPGLELDFHLADDAYITIIRQPFDFLVDIGNYLKGFANFLGLVPFRNLKEFASNFDTNPFVLMAGGVDSHGDIFSISLGFYNTIAIPGFNRLFPQDATQGQVIAGLIGRDLPVPLTSQYVVTNSRYFKNPSCGYITAWNNLWSNSDQNNFGNCYEYDRVGLIYYAVQQKLKEVGKFTFTDLQDLWSSLNSYRCGAYLNRATFQNYPSDPFPTSFRDDLLASIKAKGLAVGLTQYEIDRTTSLLVSFDGRSFPNLDVNDRMNGLNYDGRWILDQLWISMIGRNFWVYGVPAIPLVNLTASIDGYTMTVTNVDVPNLSVGQDISGPGVVPGTYITALGTGTGGVGTYLVTPSQTLASSQIVGGSAGFRNTVGGDYVVRLSITEPTGDWTPADPTQSRCLPVAVCSHVYYNVSPLLRVLSIGPQIGNPIFYQWRANILAATGIDVTTPDGKNTFLAQGLLDALTVLVKGSNAGTGLASPITGRANLDLIQDNGIPLHPGWGLNQRPTQLPVPPFITSFLINPLNIQVGYSTQNSDGQRLYAERDCCGRLVHHQTASKVGFSSLLTNNVVNGQNQVTIQPHANDQGLFFMGNFISQEIPLTIRKYRPCCHKY